MNIRKPTLWLILILVVLIIVSLIPWPVSYQKTLDAVKLDSKGNQLGTVQITLDGTRWTSLLLADRLRATVNLPENFPSVELDTNDFRRQPGNDFLSLSMGLVTTGLGNHSTDHSYAFHIHVSNDHDRWLIHIVQDNKLEVYYLFSVSQDASSEDLLDYFGIFPSK